MTTTDPRSALNDALTAYEQYVRGNCEGVNRLRLTQDENRLTYLASEMQQFAQYVVSACRVSNFINQRPTRDRLIALICDALYGELDDHAWAVIEAAAKGEG